MPLRIDKNKFGWKLQKQPGLLRAFLLVTWLLLPRIALSQVGTLQGYVTDPQGNAVAGASVSISSSVDAKSWHVITDGDGTYLFGSLRPGKYTLKAQAKGFEPLIREVAVHAGDALQVDIPLKIAADRQSVTVTVDPREASALAPDPAERVVIREETLDANPGRPGAPVSLPGLPIETASGGIKAPQYFAPHKHFSRPLPSAMARHFTPKIRASGWARVHRACLHRRGRISW